jgi:hypothetical protein
MIQKVPPITLNVMAQDGSQITLVLSHEEATELFFRCLRSPDEDSNISEIVLSKLARSLAEASEESLRIAV